MDHLMKNCSKCKQNLPLTDFGKYSQSKDGLRGTCKVCRRTKEHNSEQNKLRCKKHYIENKEDYSAYGKEYRKNNKEKVLKDKTIWRKRNSEKLNAKTREARKLNPKRFQETTRRYKSKNKHIVNANTAKRSASKINATPNWLSKEQLNEIKNLYKIASNLTKLTGIKHEVDHIIPLRNPDVCGLHVPWNLQVLTKEENNIKNNKFNMEIK